MCRNSACWLFSQPRSVDPSTHCGYWAASATALGNLHAGDPEAPRASTLQLDPPALAQPAARVAMAKPAALADGDWCLPEGESRNHCGARPERVFEGGLRGLEMDAPGKGSFN